MAGSLPEAFQRLGMVLFHTPAMEKTNTDIGNSYRIARFGGGTVIVEGLCVQTGGKRQRNKQGKKSFHRTQCNYYTVQIKKNPGDSIRHPDFFQQDRGLPLLFARPEQRDVFERGVHDVGIGFRDLTLGKFAEDFRRIGILLQSPA